jgi:hypothetical protein
MAEKHKSKYKAPKDLEKSQKPNPRKDIKSYTEDDKKGGMNPKSTGDKQLNVLRKTDKMIQDDGKYDVKYNADDRLYDDLENGEWEPKTAAKRLKKRQDAEEKEIADVIKDKVENLTREQRERLVREYVRKKIVKVLLEQEEKKDDAKTDTTAEPTTGKAPAAAATPASEPATGGAESAETPATPAAPAGASTAPAPTTPPTATGTTTTTPSAETEVSPETKEALDVDRFVQYLKKQESVLGKLKKAMLAVNLSLKDAEAEDKINFFKMLRGVSNKQLGNIDTKK